MIINNTSSHPILPKAEEKKKKKNVSTVGYIGGKLGTGAASVIEGTLDLVGGTAAKLTGNNAYAEYLAKNDIVGGWNKTLDEGKNPNKVLKFIGDAATGIGQSSTLLIPYAGVPLFYAGITGNSISSAVQKTGTLGGKEIAYGAASGAMEGILETFLGKGIGKIVGATGKTAIGNSLKSLSSVTGKTVAGRIAKGTLSEASEEFIEEFIEEYGDTLLQRVTKVEPNAKTELKDAIYAGFVGFASGGVMGATSIAINTAIKQNAGNRVINNGNAETLINAGKALINNNTLVDTNNDIINDLRQNIEVYDKITDKSSSGAKVALGSVMADIALMETANGIKTTAMDIVEDINNNSNSADRYTKVAEALTGEKYSVDDIKNNKNSIIDLISTIDYYSGWVDNNVEKAKNRQFENIINDDRNGTTTENVIADISEAVNGSVSAKIDNVSGVEEQANPDITLQDLFGEEQNTENTENAINAGKAKGWDGESITYRTDDGKYLKIIKNAENDYTVRYGEYAEVNGRPNISQQMFRSVNENSVRNAIEEIATAERLADTEARNKVKSQIAEELITSGGVAINEQGNGNNNGVEKNIRKYAPYIDDIKAERRQAVTNWIRSAINAKIDNDTINAISTIIATTDGLFVISSDLGEGNKGLFTDMIESDHLIVINPKTISDEIVNNIRDSAADEQGNKQNASKETVKATKKTLLHELIHSVEGTELYKRIRSIALKQTNREAKIRAIDNLANAYGVKTYSQWIGENGREELGEYLKVNFADTDVDEQIAYNEIVADVASEKLADIDFLYNYVQSNVLKKMIYRIKQIGRNIKELKNGNGIALDEAYIIGKYLESALATGDNLKYGITVDNASRSANPILHSRASWEASNYSQNKQQAATELASSLGINIKKAMQYINDVNSISKYIADNKNRLDYTASGLSPFVSNAEYGGSFDFTTLCAKRRLYTGTMTEIQKRLPNTALTAEDYLAIRNIMLERGYEAPCGKCYVEGSRAAMGVAAKEFIKLYKKYYPDRWIPTMVETVTPDGVELMRIYHPEAYEEYVHFWNNYGTLREGDPYLFASQQKPKLYQARSEYNGEILNQFANDGKILEKNRNGGIRFSSFSDLEIVHIIDIMQALLDMSSVKLCGQAYTKVPAMALAFGNTNLKINLSIDALSVDENGNLIFNNTEGMPFDTAMELRNKYPKNVGTICCVYNDQQLYAALRDDRIDFIIPFHRSQWKKSQYKRMGLPDNTKDYTYQQNEKWLNPSEHTHDYKGRQVKTKCTNYMPNEYWDFSKSGKENAGVYLDKCKADGKRPKFYKILANNGDGSFSLKNDGSTDGYWKLLIDYKMYDNNGVGSPQLPIVPNFNMEEVNRLLEEYKGGQNTYPAANDVVDDFVSDYKANNPRKEYSKAGILRSTEAIKAVKKASADGKTDNKSIAKIYQKEMRKLVKEKETYAAKNLERTFSLSQIEKYTRAIFEKSMKLSNIGNDFVSEITNDLSILLNGANADVYTGLEYEGTAEYIYYTVLEQDSNITEDEKRYLYDNKDTVISKIANGLSKVHKTGGTLNTKVFTKSDFEKVIKDSVSAIMGVNNEETVTNAKISNKTIAEVANDIATKMTDADLNNEDAIRKTLRKDAEIIINNTRVRDASLQEAGNRNSDAARAVSVIKGFFRSLKTSYLTGITPDKGLQRELIARFGNKKGESNPSEIKSALSEAGINISYLTESDNDADIILAINDLYNSSIQRMQDAATEYELKTFGETYDQAIDSLTDSLYNAVVNGGRMSKQNIETLLKAKINNLEAELAISQRREEDAKKYLSEEKYKQIKSKAEKRANEYAEREKTKNKIISNARTLKDYSGLKHKSGHVLEIGTKFDKARDVGGTLSRGAYFNASNAGKFAETMISALRESAGLAVSIAEGINEGNDITANLEAFERLKLSQDETSTRPTLANLIEVNDIGYIAELLNIAEQEKQYNALKETDDTVKRDPLTIDQLQALEYATNLLLRTEKYIDKTWYQGRFQSLDELGNQELEHIKYTYRNSSGESQNNFKKFLKRVYYGGVTPEAVIAIMEGSTYNGEINNGILYNSFKELQTAALRKDMRYRDYIEPIAEFIDKNKEYNKHYNEDTYTLNLKRIMADGKVKDNDIKLTVGEALALYMTSKRDQADLALSLGRIVFPAVKNGKLELSEREIMSVEDIASLEGTTEDLSKIEIKNEEQVKMAIKALEKSFTAEDNKLIDLIEDFYATKSKNDKVYTDLRLNGYTNISEKYYYPIARSGYTRMFDLLSGTGDFANMGVKKLSFNQRTLVGANSALEINDAYSVFLRHADQLSMYYEMSAELQNIQKIYNYGELVGKGDTVRKILNVNGWSQFDKYLTKVINDVQGRTLGNQGVTAGMLRSLFAKFGTATLAFNTGSSLKQGSTLIMAKNDISLDSWIKGFAPLNVRLAPTYSMAIRSRQDISTLEKAQGFRGRVGKLGEIGLKPMQFADARVCATIWSMAQQEIQAKQGYVIGSKENLTEAGKLTDDIISRWNDTADVLGKSDLARNESELMAGLAMFRNAPTKIFSEFVKSVSTLQELIKAKKNKENVSEASFKKAQKTLINVASTLIIASLFESIIGTLLNSLRGNNKDKDADEIVADTVADAAYNIIGLAPVLGQFTADALQGYDITYYGFDEISDFAGTVINNANMAKDIISGNYIPTQTIAKNTKDMLSAVGGFFGINVRSADNIVKTITNTASKSARYKYNSLYYAPLANDIDKALSAGNDKLAETALAQLDLYSKTGRNANKEALSEIVRLYSDGYNVLPKNKLLSYIDDDDNKIVLTNKQVKQFTSLYNRSENAVAGLIVSDVYNSLSDEAKAKAIKRTYDIYYDKAREEVIGDDVSNLTLMSELTDDINTFISASAAISEMKSDAKMTKKQKITKYIKKYDAEMQTLLLYTVGYRTDDIKKKMKKIIADADDPGRYATLIK